MARKKETPKPLFDLKHDFVASLDNVSQEALNLMQAVNMILREPGLPEAVKKILTERANAMRAALMSDD